MAGETMCPKCGAEEVSRFEDFITFECLSSTFQGKLKHESGDCLRRQLAKLQAIVDNLMRTVILPLSKMPEQLPEGAREILYPDAVGLDVKLNLLRTVAIEVVKEAAEAARDTP